jgi:hypothetical protein
MATKPKVKPLTKRTMTLGHLQKRTLDVLRRVKRQFQRQGFEEGMGDEEFVEEVINPLMNDISADRDILRTANKKVPQ